MKNAHKKAIAIHVTCLSSVLDLGYLLDKNLPINIKNTTIPTGTPTIGVVKWFTEFGHLNRGDMLTSEQHRCHNEKKKFQRRV
ncbi:Uncharacterised protein [Enterobacter hormaechei]|nr:Uncharacterised protein [Enterobacter hormaechei]